MQLPIKAHYATIAMLALAAQHEMGEPLQARAIAKQHEIPNQFLGQILQQLRTAGLVSSVRGASGGFRLAKPPAEISVAAIVEAICASGSSDALQFTDDPVVHVVSAVWREMSQQQMELLERLTLAELVYRLNPEHSAMFFI